MMYKMNSFCLDCLADCPNDPHGEIYVCQLAWNGQFIFVKNFNKFYELEHMQWDLLKDNEALSVEVIDKYLGLDSVPYGEKNLFFSQSNMLEFEVIPMEYNGMKIYKVHFLSLPDCLPSNKNEEKSEKKESDSMSSPNRNILIKESILSDISVLTDYVRDNFMDWHDTSVVLGRLDVIHEKVSNLEVK